MIVGLNAVWSGTNFGASSARTMDTNAIAIEAIARLNFIEYRFFFTNKSVEKSFAFAIAFLGANRE
jgi:hypothetical protein